MCEQKPLCSTAAHQAPPRALPAQSAVPSSCFPSQVHLPQFLCSPATKQGDLHLLLGFWSQTREGNETGRSLSGPLSSLTCNNVLPSVISLPALLQILCPLLKPQQKQHKCHPHVALVSHSWTLFLVQVDLTPLCFTERQGVKTLKFRAIIRCLQ